MAQITQSPEPVVSPAEPRGGTPRSRWLRRGLAIVVFAYAAWCGGIYFGQGSLVFPSYMAPSPGDRAPDGVSVVAIRTESGASVPSWFIPAPGVSTSNPAPAVLYFHGNAEIIDRQERVTALWRDLGASLMLVEYRGYGRAKEAGSPGEAVLAADGVRFFDELIRRPEVDAKRVIIQGYSIGGGVAAQVAARRPPAALILEATFTSVADFAWGYGVPPFLATSPFHTDEVLKTLKVPLFISHGRPDTIVPVEHGRRLHALVPDATYVELDCGHLNMPGDRPGPYREQIREFLMRNGILGPAATHTRPGTIVRGGWRVKAVCDALLPAASSADSKRNRYHPAQ